MAGVVDYSKICWVLYLTCCFLLICLHLLKGFKVILKLCEWIKLCNHPKYVVNFDSAVCFFSSSAVGVVIIAFVELISGNSVEPVTLQ